LYHHNQRQVTDQRWW